MPSGSRFVAAAAFWQGVERKEGPVSGEGFRRCSRLQFLVSSRFPGHAGANAIDAAVTIEQIVGVERNDLGLRRDEMNAGAFDVADAEIEAVEKLHDGDAEHVLVARSAGASKVGRQHRNSVRRWPVLSGPDESENSSMNFSRSTGCFSRLMVFGMIATSCSFGTIEVTGSTLSPLR